MIAEIEINDVATYKSHISISPRSINFIYGGNGTGKTTLSRIIADDIDGDYEIKWENDDKLKTLVFNREFVKRNFSGGINGIFTLGEDDTESLKKLDELHDSMSDIEKQLESKKRSIIKFNDQRQEAFEALAEACWAQRKAFSVFQEALQGSLKSKKSFAEACLEKRGSLGEGAKYDIGELAANRTELYSTKLVKLDLLSFSVPPEIETIEKFTLLEEPIVGSSDSPIGSFIEYLQNSSWVKEGMRFAQNSNGKCPYCQRQLPDNLEKDLESYFDANYERSCRTIVQFKSDFSNFEIQLLSQLNDCVNAVPNQIKNAKLIGLVDRIKLILKSNATTIDRKIADPSKSHSLESLKPTLVEIETEIEKINAEISRINKLVENIESEKEALNTRIWQSLIYNLKGAFADYQRKANGLSAAFSSVKNEIDSLKTRKSGIEDEISELEESRTSIAPTISAINDLLIRFGFVGFSLAEDSDHEGMYKIVRPDGEDAKETLSEGEYNFISFLYFYHLVYGSFDKEGINEPRVVVIDDPISSLDSNVMFIVTTLAKEIARDCRKEANGIKQVFVLTHNVYFHKEITFLGNRDKWPETRCAFWVINKMNDESSIEYSPSNPISTAYELLWGELRETSTVFNKNVFNTMRRILEYYFNVVGGWDYEKCINSFEGNDRVVCRALVSCINEGSHMVNDDFVMCFTPESIETYKNVFARIFEKMGHQAHYDMMMQKDATIPIQA